MLTKKALLIAAVCLVSCSVCPLLYSQATGSFSGTVADKTGSVVSGATVRITSQGTGVVREAKTDASGHYLIPLLPVADYTVRVEAQGFQVAEQKDVRLQTDEHRELNFTLNLASVSQTVEVSAAEEVAVQTENPTLGQVITSEQVAELPLNGRDFVQLATLTPGTTQETNPQSFFNGGPSSEVSARGTYSLSVGGSRAQSTDWLLDGNDNNELTAGGIAILPSIDAIQEFKVLTYNYSAEYGTRAGPTVLVTTKSGTNQFHGSLFEYFRNTSLDARSYFAATKEQFNLNQFGGALGGPIKKDKTYFFVDYQAKRQRHGIPFVGLKPELAAGLFYGISSGVMAFGLSRHGWHRLLVFLAYPYWAGILTAQWAPLILAAAFFPLLLPACMAKPQIGLPVAITHLTRRGVVACAVVLLATLILLPRWPILWTHQMGYYEHFIPLLVLPGPVLALGLWRYRDRDAQFLLLTALMPQRWFFDTLILWLIPKSRREILITVFCSWGAGIWRWYHVPHSFAEAGRWAVVCIYLPMLAVILSRYWMPGKLASQTPSADGPTT